MQVWVYRLLDRLTDLLLDWMRMLQPEKPRRQELDYTISTLPDDILAIVRISWYKDGKADEIDETVLMEDGQNGYEALVALVTSSLVAGANVSIRSGYRPEALGIQP
jgi:hypothetical protein